MGGAPTIDWLRPGVGYAPLAAASMRRLEAALGRPHDCNSSYRDWDLQQRMHDAYQRYMKGQGPHPGHSYALPPEKSKHCQGLADDSDDWTTPGYIALAAEHGWIRTAASDPTERHHFEYQVLRDRHFGRPAGNGTVTPAPISPEEDDMKRRLFQLDPAIDGRWVLVSYDTGTYWQIRNGLQLDELKNDPDVKVFHGPQTVAWIDGLNQV